MNDWELWLSVTVFPEGGKSWMFTTSRPSQPADACVRLTRQQAETMRGQLDGYLRH